MVTLTTCHNRKQLTVTAVQQVTAQVLPPDIATAHVVVDDGSIELNLAFPTDQSRVDIRLYESASLDRRDNQRDQ